MKRLGIIVVALTLLAAADVHDLVLTGQRQQLQCRAGDRINLVGDSNQITVSGDCQSLHLTGNGNQITFTGPISAIEVVGSDNTFRCAQGAPKLEALGSNNKLETSSH